MPGVWATWREACDAVVTEYTRVSIARGMFGQREGILLVGDADLVFAGPLVGLKNALAARESRARAA